jgi:hypothetical protein
LSVYIEEFELSSRQIAGCTCLKHLEVPLKALDFLDVLPETITSLVLYEIYDFNTNSPRYEHILKLLQNLHSLDHLKIPTSYIRPTFFTILSRLKILKVIQDKATDAIVYRGQKSLTALQVLEVDDQIKIHKSTLDQLIIFCPNLKSLTVSLSIKETINLLLTFPHLQRLKLYLDITDGIRGWPAEHVYFEQAQLDLLSRLSNLVELSISINMIPKGALLSLKNVPRLIFSHPDIQELEQFLGISNTEELTLCGLEPEDDVVDTLVYLLSEGHLSGMRLFLLYFAKDTEIHVVHEKLKMRVKNLKDIQLWPCKLCIDSSAGYRVRYGRVEVSLCGKCAPL